MYICFKRLCPSYLLFFFSLLPISSILSQAAPSIPRENFSALTRLDQNRAKGILASVLKVPVSAVKNVIIWGNHSKSQVRDEAIYKTEENTND